MSQMEDRVLFISDLAYVVINLEVPPFTHTHVYVYMIDRNKKTIIDVGIHVKWMATLHEKPSE